MAEGSFRNSVRKNQVHRKHIGTIEHDGAGNYSRYGNLMHGDFEGCRRAQPKADGCGAREPECGIGICPPGS